MSAGTGRFAIGMQAVGLRAAALPLLWALGCGGQESLNPSLRIRDVDPRAGPSSGGGSLEIEGRAFSGQVMVMIAGVNAPMVDVVSSRRLRVTIPPLTGHIGLGDVQVQKGSETDSLPRAYRVFAGTVDFDSYRDYPTGLVPTAAAAGDFDQNGTLDLVIAANSDDGTEGAVLLLRATSPGVFAEPETIFQTPKPSGIAAADFDRDGRLDLVVSDFDANQLLVFRNQGGAAFSSPVTLATEAMPAGVIAADIDRDAAMDVAVANKGSDSLSVFRGDPASPGSFLSPGLRIAVLDQPTALAAGDLDRNGTVDFAVANTNTMGSRNGVVTLLFSDGTGGFTEQDVTLTGQSRAVQIVDVNMDGANDVLYAKSGNLARRGGVGYLRNAGGTLFDAPVEFEAGRLPFSLATGDFNSDGRLDVALGDRASDEVTLFLGNTDPNTVFTESAMPLGVGSGAFVVLAARFNNDMLLDLVVLNENGGDVSVLFGGASGAFTQPVTVDLPGTAEDVIAADTAGGGVADLVVAIGASGVALLRRSGASGVGAPVVTAIAGSPALLTALPRNRVACAGPGDGGLVHRLTAMATGPFEERPEEPPLGGVPDPAALISADLDRDGRQDLVVGSGGDGSVRVLRQRPDGGYDALEAIPAVVSSCAGLAVSDWNGDGRVDLAVADAGAPQVALLFGLGTGEFAVPALSVPLDAPATALVAVDADGNAVSDLLVGEAGLDDIQTLLATGTGGFTPGGAYSLTRDASRLVIGDWNFDGLADVLAVQPTGNSVSLLLGQPDRTFAPAQIYGVGRRPVAATAFDLNGALPLDIVVASFDDRPERLVSRVTLLTNLSR